jgi:YD repeat-containing protein
MICSSLNLLRFISSDSLASESTKKRSHFRGARHQEQLIGATYQRLIYAYELADRVTSVTYPSGRQVTYGYDTLGRVNLVRTRRTRRTGRRYAAMKLWLTPAAPNR